MTNEREFMIEIGVSFDDNMLENEEEYYNSRITEKIL